MEEYRFVSLVRNEVPLEKVRAVRERRSALDALFGIGDVHVRAGATGDLSVTVRAVYESTGFADEVRREMGRATGGTASDDGDADGDRTADAPIEASPSVDLERGVRGE